MGQMVDMPQDSILIQPPTPPSRVANLGPRSRSCLRRDLDLNVRSRLAPISRSRNKSCPQENFGQSRRESRSGSRKPKNILN